MLREEIPAGSDAGLLDQRLFEVTVTITAVELEDGTYELQSALSFRDLNTQTESAPGTPAFINRAYKPAQPRLELTKLLEGQALSAGQFQFELWQNGVLIEEGITHDAEGKISILPPQITAPGEYNYQVKETAGNAEGYTYDTGKLFTVKVTAAEDEQGALAIEKYEYFLNGRLYDGALAFVNQYTSPTPEPSEEPTTEPSAEPSGEPSAEPSTAPSPEPSVAPSVEPSTDPPVTDPPATDPPVTDPPVTDPPATDPPVTEPPVTDPPVTDPPATDSPTTEPPVTDPPVTDPPTPSYPQINVPLSVKKELKNGTLKAGAFTFQLKDKTGKVLAEDKNAADGTVVFPDRTFTREVTNYLYTISEVKGADARMTYDTRVYTVKVTTKAVDGALQATVNIEKDGVPFAGEMVFTNKLPSPPTGDHSFRLLMTLAVIVPLLFMGAYILRRKRGN